MQNIKEELLRDISTSQEKLIALRIILNKKTGRDVVSLPVGFALEDFNNAMEELNFEYDDNNDDELISGFVWLTNNAWLERADYDGISWWEKRQRPQINVD